MGGPQGLTVRRRPNFFQPNGTQMKPFDSATSPVHIRHHKVIRAREQCARNLFISEANTSTLLLTFISQSRTQMALVMD